MRENTEKIAPPRALWVPFELGRPFGAPDDPEFQLKVLRAALDLLAAESGPVLADFPEDAPPAPSADGGEGWVCPVAFPPPPADPNDLGAAVQAEIGGLAPWYQESVRARGRTSVGAGDLDIEQAADYAARFLESSPETGREAVVRLKYAIEDLKAFYGEAATARPGASSLDIADWMWNETALGRLMRQLAAVLGEFGDADLAYFAEKSLVPRKYR
ncbi:MAG: hypothetical protein QF654_02065 [Alphaproteobacteria bacterium]|nr:hypothetical protein [Alphaproteobacteria bacterium]